MQDFDEHPPITIQAIHDEFFPKIREILEASGFNQINDNLIHFCIDFAIDFFEASIDMHCIDSANPGLFIVLLACARYKSHVVETEAL